MTGREAIGYALASVLGISLAAVLSIRSGECPGREEVLAWRALEAACIDEKAAKAESLAACHEVCPHAVLCEMLGEGGERAELANVIAQRGGLDLGGCR